MASACVPFAMPPFDRTSTHNMPTNKVIMGPGMAQPPFFDPGYPSYINYAAVGHLVGHEVTHGFDEVGKKYDATGRLKVPSG